MPNNGFVSRFLSLEVLGGFVVTVFLVGVSWASLTDDVDGLKARVNDQAIKQEKLGRDVNSIKTNVEVIKADQRHTKESVQDIKDDLRNIQMLLERRYRNQN